MIFFKTAAKVDYFHHFFEIGRLFPDSKRQIKKDDPAPHEVSS